MVVDFDNSKVNIPKKFQRFGSCANMVIATCRLFAKPTLRDYVETMDIPEEIIPITYIDQPIPSPYGMPRFEDVVEWNVSVLEILVYSISKNPLVLLALESLVTANSNVCYLQCIAASV